MARKRASRKQNVNADGFAQAIEQILAEYGDGCQGVLMSVLPEVADEACKKVKNAGKSEWTVYNDGWTVDSGKTGKFSVNATVHNATRYQLTHLLEYSHPMPQGGSSKAYPHIAPVNDWVQDEVIKKVEEKLNNDI